jgi:hypothetical protein
MILELWLNASFDFGMIGVEILDTRGAMIQYAIKVIMTIVIKLEDEGIRQVRS